MRKQLEEGKTIIGEKNVKLNVFLSFYKFQSFAKKFSKADFHEI